MRKHITALRVNCGFTKRRKLLSFRIACQVETAKQHYRALQVTFENWLMTPTTFPQALISNASKGETLPIFNDHEKQFRSSCTGPFRSCGQGSGETPDFVFYAT